MRDVIIETSRNSAKADNKDADVELASLREQHRVPQTENVFLKEKNETLFKLGKMAIDNRKVKDSELEIVEDQDEDGLDTLVQSSVENRNNGYKRANPSTFAEKAKGVKSKNADSDKNRGTANQANINNQGNTNNQADPNNQANNHNQAKANNQSNTNNNFNARRAVQYCHYFSNFGKCMHEEATGYKCKFTHQKAPLCNFDGRCNRNKCMFSHVNQMTPPGSPSHPQQHAGQSFLPQGYLPQMSPWQLQQAAWMYPTQFGGMG